LLPNQVGNIHQPGLHTKIPGDEALALIFTQIYMVTGRRGEVVE